MAFPIPPHLPRKKDQDVSTKMLSKMSETNPKSLTHEIASSWVVELDVAINQTKERIQERIQADRPAFERQLASSKSVQERLQSLTANVDSLNASLSDPQTGLVPNLIVSLTRHAALAQDALDASVRYEVMSYLAQCRTGLQNLVQLAQAGQLPDAMKACGAFEQLLANPPPPLPDTELLPEIKRAFRAVKDRTDEQLNDAYSRSIVVNASEIIVRSSVKVRASETILPLASVVSSLTPMSLNTVMGTLRRDLTVHCISRLLTEPTSVEVSSLATIAGDAEHKLTITLIPPHSETLFSRINNLATVLTFLNDYLFPHLPSSVGFPSSLSKPITSAVLNDLLVPSIPPGSSKLPAFLELTDRAVQFEQEYIVGILGGVNKDRDIKGWGDAVMAHYERKRRVDLLDHARTLVVRPDDDRASFQVTVVIAPTNGSKEVETPIESERASSPEDVAWGFDSGDGDGLADEDAWKFDDEAGQGTQQGDALDVQPVEVQTEKEADPGDAWDWDDNEEQPAPADEAEVSSSDSFAWDDPWGEGTSTIPSPSKPKTASRLEKLSHKGNANKDAPPVQSPVPVPPPPPTPAMSSSVQTKPASSQPRIEQESYLVSGRVKEVVSLMESILEEASELASSSVLGPYAARSSSPIGNTLYQAAAQVLDLYRALYPVTAAMTPSSSPKRCMCFSNDCLWMNEQVLQVSSRKSIPSTTSDRLRESSETFKLLADSWYDDSICAQEQKINTTLDKTAGFIGTIDQDRFDECESAVNIVLQDIRRVAQQCKPVLTKSKYYRAIGMLVNTALSRVLNDILALPDITAEESHKLSEICRILNALEGLFVEDHDQPSFVVAYVPLWLKFSYLSELLEASIADISYLFEEGALVDFEIGELVNLVRALFADTPLRANAISKLMQGHPVVVS